MAPRGTFARRGNGKTSRRQVQEQIREAALTTPSVRLCRNLPCVTPTHAQSVGTTKNGIDASLWASLELAQRNSATEPGRCRWVWLDAGQIWAREGPRLVPSWQSPANVRSMCTNTVPKFTKVDRRSQHVAPRSQNRVAIGLTRPNVATLGQDAAPIWPTQGQIRPHSAKRGRIGPAEMSKEHRA